jgi:hypothetical protein
MEKPPQDIAQKGDELKLLNSYRIGVHVLNVVRIFMDMHA